MSSQIVRFPAPGCVVEFMQGGRPVQAWVVGEQSGNLRLYTVNKRETKLPAARLLPWSGPMFGASASRADMDARLEEARARREEIARGIDLSQLWELAQGEVPQADVAWFAELLWPDPDVDRVAALGQAMLARKTHFKFSPPYFEIFTASQVEERAGKQAREDRLNEIATVGGEFFRRLLESSRNRARLEEKELPPPDMAGELTSILMERIADPDAHDAEGIWKTLTKNLSAKNAPDDPHLAMRLAVSWGIVPEHYNFLLDRAGYERGDDWPAGGEAFVDGLISEIKERLPELPELAGGRSFASIDPEETKDFDDAVFVRETAGGWEVCLAIACPAWRWPFGEAFDRQALRRASSLYLPEGDLFMLPRRLCLEAYSLKAGEERPVMLLSISLDKELNVLEARPEPGRLALAANLSLARCEAALEGRPDAAAAPLAPMLESALALARALREKRIANGAVITERVDPEMSLSEENGEAVINIRPGVNYENSQLLVGELMILGNSALADWAAAREIPLFFRHQAASPPRESSGVWTEPHEIHRVLKGVPPARMGVEPRPHAGVGVQAYTSLTAPMRRYPDLVNQAQLLSFIMGGAPRLDKKELEALLGHVSARQDAVSQVQRFRTRYWKLLFLQQQDRRNKGLKYWEAVITDENNAFVTAVLRLTGIVLRGPRQLFGDRVVIGAAVGVRVGKISPLRNEIQIMEVVDY